MYLQKALRTSLALLLVCGLASFSGAIAATARSETAQETAIGPDAADALARMVGLRATSQLVVAGHTRTFIAGRTRTCTVVPIPIMEPVLSRQVWAPPLLLMPQ
jgi:hypothetical protein